MSEYDLTLETMLNESFLMNVPLIHGQIIKYRNEWFVYGIWENGRRWFRIDEEEWPNLEKKSSGENGKAYYEGVSANE